MTLYGFALFALGAGGAVGAHLAFAIVRRLLGLGSARDRAEALRDVAERRAKDAEERLRLAELELAAAGRPMPEPSRRVNIRPR